MKTLKTIAQFVDSYEPSRIKQLGRSYLIKHQMETGEWFYSQIDEQLKEIHNKFSEALDQYSSNENLTKYRNLDRNFVRFDTKIGAAGYRTWNNTWCVISVDSVQEVRKLIAQTLTEMRPLISARNRFTKELKTNGSVARACSICGEPTTGIM
jgi:hypothetical protein